MEEGSASPKKKMCKNIIYQKNEIKKKAPNVFLGSIKYPRIVTFFPAQINKGPQNNVFFFLGGVVVVRYLLLL